MQHVKSGSLSQCPLSNFPRGRSGAPANRTSHFSHFSKPTGPKVHKDSYGFKTKNCFKKRTKHPFLVTPHHKNHPPSSLHFLEPASSSDTWPHSRVKLAPCAAGSRRAHRRPARPSGSLHWAPGPPNRSWRPSGSPELTW